MIDDRAEYDWAESLQMDADDSRFRVKAWAAGLCILAALLVAAAAGVALVFG